MHLTNTALIRQHILTFIIVYFSCMSLKNIDRYTSEETTEMGPLGHQIQTYSIYKLQSVIPANLHVANGNV